VTPVRLLATAQRRFFYTRNEDYPFASVAGWPMAQRVTVTATTGRYMQSGDNLLLLGPPGVGKSHLAIALGVKACEQGVRTLFSSATALIATLGKVRLVSHSAAIIFELFDAF
jgi:DNA replication protein DnaC